LQSFAIVLYKRHVYFTHPLGASFIFILPDVTINVSSLCWLATSLADSQHNKHDKYLLLCVQCWNSWRWTVDLSETHRVLYQNKFEK
jgi:hypothetical protein